MAKKKKALVPEDKDGFAIVPKGTGKYSTIDQHRDGNAHPVGHKHRGPFFNRLAPKPELTELAKKILEESNREQRNSE